MLACMFRWLQAKLAAAVAGEARSAVKAALQHVVVGDVTFVHQQEKAQVHQMLADIAKRHCLDVPVEQLLLHDQLKLHLYETDSELADAKVGLLDSLIQP